MDGRDESGLITRGSQHTVDDTVAFFTAILKAKGITIFALIDHSGEAARVGLEMRPTKLLIFGSPKAGTPPMLASPTSAIDLPLKILVWQDGAGTTRITYNSSAYLGARHHISNDLLKNISGIEALVAEAVR